MKTTKLYLANTVFFYDCWVCGSFNRIDVNDRGVTNGTTNIYRGTIHDKIIKVTCGKCGAKRKGLVDLQRYVLTKPKTLKKLRKIQKAWKEEHKKQVNIKVQKAEKKYLHGLKRDSRRLELKEKRQKYLFKKRRK